jgi:hypothetical protein
VPLIQPYEHKAEIPMRFGSGTLGPDMWTQSTKKLRLHIIQFIK